MFRALIIISFFISSISFGAFPEDQKNICYAKTLGPTTAVSFCNKVKNWDWRNLCYTMVIGTDFYCKKIVNNDMRSYCEAIRFGQLYRCDSIRNIEIKNLCVAHIIPSVNRCEKVISPNFELMCKGIGIAYFYCNQIGLK